MKKTLLLVAIAAAMVVGSAAIAAGEDIINSKCKVAATNPSVGDTTADTDCKWGDAVVIEMQCDGAVYYSRDGSTPDTDYPKVAVGDPYPIHTHGRNGAIKFLPVSGTATCNFFNAPEYR